MARRSVAALHGAKVFLNCMRNGFVWSHVAISNRNRNMMLEQYCIYRYDTHIVICRYQRVIAKAHRLSTATNQQTFVPYEWNVWRSFEPKHVLFNMSAPIQFDPNWIDALMCLHLEFKFWTNSFGRFAWEQIDFWVSTPAHFQTSSSEAPLNSVCIGFCWNVLLAQLRLPIGSNNMPIHHP